MKKKKLHIILTIFLLVVFCIMALLSVGCYLVDPQVRYESDRDAMREKTKREAEEQAAKKEEKLTEVEQTAPAEEAAEDAIASEGEQVTYSGTVSGAKVILIVDFKTTEVTGSINLSGDDYINATIEDGKININTLEITSKYSGTGRLESEGEDYQVNGTITGTIADDLSTFKGIIKSDYEDEGTEFIAAKDS